MTKESRDCAFHGCDKPARYLQSTICQGHYRQHAKGERLRPLRAYTRLSEGRVCEYPDCGRKRHSGELCVTHYDMRRNGKPLRPIGASRSPNYNEKGERCCRGCDSYLPVGDFPMKADGYRASRCLACTRDTRAQSTYGLKPGEWHEMFASQGESCFICGTDESGGRGWHTDHNHACCPGHKSCGKCVRGILCARCNSTLGYVDDCPETLRKMASYLEANN